MIKLKKITPFFIIFLFYLFSCEDSEHIDVVSNSEIVIEPDFVSFPNNEEDFYQEMLLIKNKGKSEGEIVGLYVKGDMSNCIFIEHEFELPVAIRFDEGISFNVIKSKSCSDDDHIYVCVSDGAEEICIDVYFE